MINRKKLLTHILLALAIGALFAAAFTHITYPCLPHPDDASSYCVSFEIAVMHPTDLAANMQGSLTQFLLKLLVVFVIVLVLLIAFSNVWAWVKRRRSLTASAAKRSDNN